MHNPEVTAIKVEKTLEDLTARGVLPSYSAFDITEHMLSEYIKVYGALDGGGKRKFEYGLARKFAGLNIMGLKFSRGSKTKDCKEGMVYLIANPAWPDHLKIGMTIDVDDRLASYQTYDPFKAYYVKNYEFCLDRRLAEQQLLERFDIHLVEGEWIKHSDSLEIIKFLRTY